MRRSWRGSLRKMMLIVRKSDQVPSIKQSTEAWNQWRDDDCSLVGHYELLDQMLQCSGKEGKGVEEITTLVTQRIN